MIKIAAILGTNSIESTNRSLLNFMKDHFKNEALITLIEIKDLPICEKDLESHLPKLYLEISELIKNSHALLIASPEYDRAPTASLLNFLEWLSLDKQIIKDKPTLLLSASYGGLGGSRAQFMLRQILAHKDLSPSIYGEAFYLPYSKDAFLDNRLVNEEKSEELDSIFKDFIEKIKRDNKWK